MNTPLKPILKDALTPEVVHHIREVLGINTSEGDDRREKRRESRHYLRRWLSKIGAAKEQLP